MDHYDCVAGPPNRRRCELKRTMCHAGIHGVKSITIVRNQRGRTESEKIALSRRLTVDRPPCSRCVYVFEAYTAVPDITNPGIQHPADGDICDCLELVASVTMDDNKHARRRRM